MKRSRFADDQIIGILKERTVAAMRPCAREKPNMAAWMSARPSG